MPELTNGASGAWPEGVCLGPAGQVAIANDEGDIDVYSADRTLLFTLEAPSKVSPADLAAAAIEATRISAEDCRIPFARRQRPASGEGHAHG